MPTNPRSYVVRQQSKQTDPNIIASGLGHTMIDPTTSQKVPNSPKAAAAHRATGPTVGTLVRKVTTGTAPGR
jgi:hypothetical protein